MMETEKVPVLDHGYVQLIEAWGSDQRVIEAARMSTNKGFLGWGPVWKCRECGTRWHEVETKHPLNEAWALRSKEWKLFDASEKPKACCDNAPDFLVKLDVADGDERLLRFLWSKRHTTPFEMAGAIFEVKAPIMVFREWHRHRTQSYNEMSARYTQMPDEHFLPTLERVKVGASTNKQAQGVAPLASDKALQAWLDEAAELQRSVYAHYELGLSLGVPKELARLNTPVARYSVMRASGNLLNWLRFLGLRNDPDAQAEIRAYAVVVQQMLAGHFQRTLGLFEEKRL